MPNENRPPGDEGLHVGQTDGDRNDGHILGGEPRDFHRGDTTPKFRSGSARDEIEIGLPLLFGSPGRVVELRALGVRGVGGKGVVSGYFTDKEKFIEAALELDGRAAGIYATMNVVNPALLARANNRLVYQPKQTTSEGEILRRVYLLIDTDPKRPSGISATDAELALALNVAREIVDFLASKGFPEPARAMSGNGGHSVYAIDLPAADQGLIADVLRALAFRFNTNAVTVDESVSPACQLLKLYGTQARKGDPTSDRPHRRSFIRLPKGGMSVVPTELLRKVASLAPEVDLKAGTDASGRDLDIDGLLDRAGIEVEQAGEWSGGRRWVLKVCPFNPEHQDSAAYVVRLASGALAAGCHHNSCQGRGWHDLRDRIDPGWQDRRAGSVSSVSVVHGAPTKTWTDPEPLPSELLPVAPFELGLLPESFQEWIADIAERIQCPPDFPAVAAMVAIAGVVGRKIGIRPKRHDDWLVVPNLWGTAIGRPGVLKTPAILEPLKPLKRLELEAKKKFEDALTDFEAKKLVAEAQKKKSKDEIREALEEGRDGLEEAKRAAAAKPKLPHRHRYLVNDSTVEKLGELLNQNPNGLVVYRDELVGLLFSLDKEGQEGARSFYLEAWNGTGRYTYDRVERGTVDIEAAIVSILGGIQPGPLGAYLHHAVAATVQDDGLMQRFQLGVWPDISKQWKNVDRWPDSEARKLAFEVFESLDQLDPAKAGATTDEFDDDAIPWVRFTDNAQDLFDSWRAELERRARSGEEHPAIESHIAKYRSLVPSLALLIHLAEGQAAPVGEGPLKKAIGWAGYLETHARRIYSVAVNPDLFAARALAGKLENGAIKDGFSLRDVYRPGWTHLASRDQAKRAVEALIDHGWLCEVVEKNPNGGAPATTYRINPRVSERPGNPTDKTDKTSSDPSSVSSGSTPTRPPVALPEGFEEVL
jgi:hypothetical protein